MSVHRSRETQRCQPRVAAYLEALGHVCLEAARDPKLLPVFLRIVRRAPRTIRELSKGGLRDTSVITS